MFGRHLNNVDKIAEVLVREEVVIDCFITKRRLLNNCVLTVSKVTEELTVLTKLHFSKNNL